MVARLPSLHATVVCYISNRGTEDSKMYQKKGLVYTALDSNGNKIGTPIKASDFYSKPTLKNLEEKFVQNESLRQEHKPKVMTAIKWVLVKKKTTLNEFKQELAREGVNVVLRQNSQGNIYGLTYIDFRSKCVFNGSDLGKEYSAKGIMERLNTGQHDELNLGQKQTTGLKQGNNMDHDHNQDQEQSHKQKNKQEMSKVLELLLKPERNDNHLPYELLKKKRKKQSRGLHL